MSAPPSLAFPLGHLLVVACHGIAGRRLHVPIVGSFVTVARSLVAPCTPGAQGIADAIWIEAQLGGTLDEGRNVRWGALLRSVHAERLPANFRAQTYGSLSPSLDLPLSDLFEQTSKARDDALSLILDISVDVISQPLAQEVVSGRPRKSYLLCHSKKGLRLV